MAEEINIVGIWGNGKSVEYTIVTVAADLQAGKLPFMCCVLSVLDYFCWLLFINNVNQMFFALSFFFHCYIIMSVTNKMRITGHCFNKT